jgi:hypothetical protein
LSDEVIRRVGEYSLLRCSAADIPSVMLVNEKTLESHFSGAFYHDLLDGFPEGFLVVEWQGSVVGYVMNRVEFGFSKARRFILTKKDHVLSVQSSGNAGGGAWVWRSWRRATGPWWRGVVRRPSSRSEWGTFRP